MEESDIYEGLGLERPDPEVEKPVQEPSVPEVEETAQEGEDSALEVEGPAPEAEGPAPEVEETPAPEGEALRHQREAAQQAAIDEAYRTAFAGKLDPYTQKPITTKAEFDAYQARYQEEQQKAELERMRQAGVDPAAIRAIIDQHPVVQQAQQVIQEAQAERERAQADRAKGWFGEQLQQINALDPEAKVSSLDELAVRDPGSYQQMLGMVSRGISLVDAYKMTHFEKLTAKRAGAAKQAVLNQTAGKAHLAPVGGQGKAGVEVPADVRTMYRDLNPDMTDEQISKAYANYLKEIE